MQVTGVGGAGQEGVSDGDILQQALKNIGLSQHKDQSQAGRESKQAHYSVSFVYLGFIVLCVPVQGVMFSLVVHGALL